MFSLVWIMPLRVMTRSAGRPAAESFGGGTGVQVGRGEGVEDLGKVMSERVIDDLMVKEITSVMVANRGVEGVNGNVEGANKGASDFSTIIAQQLQNLLPSMLAQGGAVVILLVGLRKLENEQDISGCSELARLVPHLVTPENRMIERYVYGLAPQIRRMVAATKPKTMQKAVQIASA
ncbi:hypothetical protein Tco_0858099 [Tanacetum coccineum]|uniref:Uncharacterized protein n=1 Tax=Tanacetum coccineum TaxID=301880 RepID=A0ABQ5BAC6_9ASTR